MNAYYEIIQSKSLEHLNELVNYYDPDKSDYILTICGGDGTIHLVLNLYMKKWEKTGVPLNISILPGGTANDTCKIFDIVLENEQFQLERLIRNPTIRKIDTIKLKITN